MKGKNSDEVMSQSAVRLPRSLHERLKKAGGARGMGEEIRRRLEASFEAEGEAPTDPKTRELLEAISFLATRGAIFYGDWSEDAFAFQVLKGSVDMLFKRYQPEGDLVHPKANPTELGETIFGKNGENENRSPEDVSQALLRFWLMTKAILEPKG
jgi:hypothetical protein